MDDMIKVLTILALATGICKNLFDIVDKFFEK